MVRLEEFEFPFYEDRTPPVLVAQEPDGGEQAVRTLTNSGSGDVTGRLLRRSTRNDVDDAAPASR